MAAEAVETASTVVGVLRGSLAIRRSFQVLSGIESPGAVPVMPAVSRRLPPCRTTRIIALQLNWL
jgi:hypothetical protein